MAVDDTGWDWHRRGCRDHVAVELLRMGYAPEVGHKGCKDHADFRHHHRREVEEHRQRLRHP